MMWAWPRLLGWPRRVNWLFSPVVGNKRHPGDLWGLDSRGTLLIVETKLDRGRPQDLFVDFVPYAASRQAQMLCRSGDLAARWEPLVKREERFLRRAAHRLSVETRLTGLHPGVLPYSVHREVIWRWQALYRARIAPRFRGGTYRRAVLRGLRMRQARGNPPPVFIGLIASVSPRVPTLSRKGAASMQALTGQVGSERVVLRPFQAAQAGRGIDIECFTPPA